MTGLRMAPPGSKPAVMARDIEGEQMQARRLARHYPLEVLSMAYPHGKRRKGAGQVQSRAPEIMPAYGLVIARLGHMRELSRH